VDTLIPERPITINTGRAVRCFQYSVKPSFEPNNDGPVHMLQYFIVIFVKVLADSCKAALLIPEIILILLNPGLFYLPCRNTHVMYKISQQSSKSCRHPAQAGLRQIYYCSLPFKCRDSETAKRTQLSKLSKTRNSRMTQTATQNAIVRHTNSYCHYYKMTVTNIIMIPKHIEYGRSMPGNPPVGITSVRHASANSRIACSCSAADR